MFEFWFYEKFEIFSNIALKTNNNILNNMEVREITILNGKVMISGH